MSQKVQARRAKLRETLIDVAERRISKDGAMALKARDVAQDAGCALGAIYTHFEDMEALVMAVNGRTFRRLGAFVTEAITKAHATAPQDRLVVMGHAYFEFAEHNTLLWRALFDLKMSAGQGVPDWYLAELMAVFEIIEAPLRELYPDEQDGEIGLRVRMLFSSVHGIVLLGLERRISAVPPDQIKHMISQLLLGVGPQAN